MLTSVWRHRRVTILASLLALALMTVTGFATKAGAAALTQPYAPTGATGTGVNAPPQGSLPFNSTLWDARDYRTPYYATSCPQPPQSVQARLALADSPTLLLYYGLPTLHDLGQTKWTEVVTHMQKRDCNYTVPVFGGQVVRDTNGSTPNRIWGGFGAQQCSGCWQFQAVQANFTVQTIVPSTKTDVSIWVGTGGANADPLVQSGVSQDSTNFRNSYYAFYEYVQACGCGGTGERDVYSVSSYDQMYFYAATNGQTYLDDYTKGQYYNEQTTGSSTDSAEVIVERNGWSNPAYGNISLANYGVYYLSAVKYELTDNTWYYLDATPENFWVWNLENNSSQFLESNTNFADYSDGSAWYENWLRGS